MIAFHSSYRNLGGVEQFVLLLSRELQLQGVPHKFLGPADSVLWRLMAAHLPSERLFDTDSLFGWRRAPANPARRREALTPADVLLLPNPQDAVRLRWPNPRVLSWNVAPEILLLGKVRPVRWLNRHWKAWMLRHLLARDSLCFMDDVGVRWLQRTFNVAIARPALLPVPTVTAERNRFLERTRNLGAKLTLTYLGRAVDWKAYPCAHFLNQAAESIVIAQVHVFTDDAAAFRRLLAGRCVLPAEKLVFHENVYEEELKAKLVELADLHFAMGTSALDGAGLGLPTVLIDPFTDPALAHLARYRWMYETRCYSLGELITPENRASFGRPLGELLRELREDPAGVSARCQDYVRAHHDLPAIARRLVELTARVRARLRSLHVGTALDLLELLPKKLGRSEVTSPRRRQSVSS